MTTSAKERTAAGDVPVWLDLQGGVPAAAQLRSLIAGNRIVGAGLGPDATVATARRVCDTFRTAREEGRGGQGAVVLSPTVSPDTEAAELVRRAASLADRTDRPGTAVRLPSNDAGLTAMGVLLGRGLPVHLATCFSARRYEQAAAAYLAALERARAEGHDLGGLASTVAFGLQPLDLRVDALLDRAGSAEAKALRGTAALLAARLAHRSADRIFDAGSPAWRKLAAAGARPLRLVWAELGGLAPGGGDPARYTAELVTADTAVAVRPGELGSLAGLRPRRGRPCGAHEAAEHFDACLDWFGIGAQDVVRELEGEPGTPAPDRAQVAGGVA
ncbi:transaldolase family protein [Streptomyces bacillaris]|uniref:transaldolase family protein n=1 Tax=Streptomyces bacillaris TaxID=68179 RepID=UPI0035DC8988